MQREKRGERRKCSRTQMHASAMLCFGERSAPVRLVNVSLGGAMIELERDYTFTRNPCVLWVEFGRDPEEALSLPVTVAGVTTGGARVKWDRALDAVDLLKLRRLKERELPQVKVVDGRLPMLVWPDLSARDESP